MKRKNSASNARGEFMLHPAESVDYLGRCLNRNRRKHMHPRPAMGVPTLVLVLMVAAGCVSRPIEQTRQPRRFELVLECQSQTANLGDHAVFALHIKNLTREKIDGSELIFSSRLVMSGREFPYRGRTWNGPAHILPGEEMHCGLDLGFFGFPIGLTDRITTGGRLALATHTIAVKIEDVESNAVTVQIR